jgi:hypothetical protein
MLVARLEKRPLQDEHILFTPELIVRESSIGDVAVTDRPQPIE